MREHASGRDCPASRKLASGVFGEKILPCFRATAPLSGNARRGWENSSEKTALGSALDYNGNTTSKTDSTGTTNYTWDYENRLAQVTLPGQGGTVTFKYDPFGRRIYKSSASGTTIYAYDGDNVIETTNQSGGILSRFAQGQNIDEPLAESTSSGIDYYEADGLGSITSLTNGVGTVAQTYTYDSFGNTTHSTGSLANPFQYTAREFDSETGLYYYRARYYDPATGRFLSEDPGRFPAGINFYRYGENSPVNFLDPSGFCPWHVEGRPLRLPWYLFPLSPINYYYYYVWSIGHYYFYNTQTGQSLGLGPANGFSPQTAEGDPLPGEWERNESPGNDIGSVPDWMCKCVDEKLKHPGDPPRYCTYEGNKNGNPHPFCANCLGWINGVLKGCYDEGYGGPQ